MFLGKFIHSIIKNQKYGPSVSGFTGKSSSQFNSNDILPP